MMLRYLTLTAILSSVVAWTTPGGGSLSSSFGGNVLILERPLTSPTYPSGHRANLEMKKGKANVPPQMRGQYKRQQEMKAQQEQMLAATKPGRDGLPVFNLYVRTKKANMWYPCGSFKGDERSGGLAKNYADGNLLAGVSKKQIDTGIASSLYRDQAKLADTICRAYPQLRKSRNEFQYGYKLAYDGLSKEKADEIKVVEPKESKGIVDNVKNLFS